ncbi:MAG: PAS domain S-box protein [Anaerolineae bacterium]
MSARIGLIAAAVLLYAAVYLIIAPSTSSAATALVALPVLVAAWFGGLPAGLVAAVLAIPLNILLLEVTGDDGLATVLAFPFGYVLLFIGALAFGSIRALTTRLQDQTLALEREQAEIARQEAIFHDLFNASPDAIIVMQPEGPILDANPAASALLKTGSLTGRTLPEVAPEEHRAALAGELRRISENTARFVNTTVYNANGDAIPAEIKISRINYDDQPALLMHIRDVSERQQFAEELERQLRESLLLNRVISTATSTLDASFILSTMCQELAKALDLPLAGFALLNDEGTQLEVIAEYTQPGLQSALGAVFPVEGNASVEHIFKERQPFISIDIRADPRLDAAREVLSTRGTVSLLLVPMVLRGEIVGTRGVDAIEPRIFSPD